MLVGTECHPELKQCACIEGYHYRNGQCRKTNSYNEKCTTNDDCYDGYDIESLQCDSGKCKCSKTYSLRLDTDCRRKSSK